MYQQSEHGSAYDPEYQEMIEADREAERLDSRDQAHLRAARSRGFERMASPLQRQSDVSQGRWQSVVEVGPRREDGHFYAPKYVPVGFGRYEPPTINPLEYDYVMMAQWRVALPRGMPAAARRDILGRIYQYGPESVGYKRIGDSLVPKILPGPDRMTLNNVATGFDSYGKNALPSGYV